MFTEDQLQEKTSQELIALMLEQQQKYQATIACLTEQLKLYQHRQFAKKSEKYSDDDPQQILFDEAQLLENKKEIEQVENEITIASHKRKPGRKPLPKDLPREQQVHDLSEADKLCPCGCQLTHIGDERSEQLNIIPAKVYIIEHIYRKYACKTCEQTIKQAKAPTQPIPKSIAAPGLFAHVLVSKYVDHLPLYRQEHILQRTGVDIARATLSNWVIKCGELLKPLYKLLQYQIQNYDVAYADETRVQVLKEPDRPAEANSYMWLVGGGPPKQFAWIYHYAASRGNQVLHDLLEDFNGHLHVDGYRAYDTFAQQRDINLVGCWWHMRRYFVEADKVSQNTGLATVAIKYCKKLAKIEKSIKQNKLSPEKIKLAREHQTLPIINEFKVWLDKYYPSVPPQSLIGKAIAYALGQWPKLLNHLKDGRLEISNNRTERAIKPFVIGRKAWLFANSIAGAQASSIIYSLIETCKEHNIQPYDYLNKVLTEIPAVTTEEQLEMLLPYNIKF